MSTKVSNNNNNNGQSAAADDSELDDSAGDINNTTAAAEATDRSSNNEQQSNTSGNNSDSTVIKTTDMPDNYQTDAINAATTALAQYTAAAANTNTESSSTSRGDLHTYIARYIKKLFDLQYGGVWHCIVGKNFGSNVVHQSKTFIYFYMGNIAVLLFKSGSAQLQ